MKDVDTLVDLIADRLLERIEEELLNELERRLRILLLAAHLGDDYLLSYEEAARILGVSVKTVANYCHDGTIRHGRIGRLPRISVAQLRHFAREVARDSIHKRYARKKPRDMEPRGL